MLLFCCILGKGTDSQIKLRYSARAHPEDRKNPLRYNENAEAHRPEVKSRRHAAAQFIEAIACSTPRGGEPLARAACAQRSARW